MRDIWADAQGRAQTPRRQLLAEEAITLGMERLAADPRLNPTLWERALFALKAVGRRLGLRYELTDGDLRVLLDKGQRATRRAESSRTAEVPLMRTKPGTGVDQLAQMVRREIGNAARLTDEQRAILRVVSNERAGEHDAAEIRIGDKTILFESGSRSRGAALALADGYRLGRLDARDFLRLGDMLRAAEVRQSPHDPRVRFYDFRDRDGTVYHITTLERAGLDESITAFDSNKKGQPRTLGATAASLPEQLRRNTPQGGDDVKLARVSRKQQRIDYYRELAKKQFPAMPDTKAESLARYLAENKTVMQSEELAPNEAIKKAVWAFIRHEFTSYDSAFEDGIDRSSNREIVRKKIERLYDEWRGVNREEQQAKHEQAIEQKQLDDLAEKQQWEKLSEFEVPFSRPRQQRTEYYRKLNEEFGGWEGPAYKGKDPMAFYRASYADALRRSQNPRLSFSERSQARREIARFERLYPDLRPQTDLPLSRPRGAQDSDVENLTEGVLRKPVTTVVGKLPTAWESVNTAVRRKLAETMLRTVSAANKDTGWLISPNNDGRSKIPHEAQTDADFAAVASTEQLIQNAVLVKSRADTKGRPGVSQVHILIAPFEYQGEPYRAKLTVLETAGRKLYALSLTEIEKLAAGLATQSPGDYSSRDGSASYAKTVADLVREVKTDIPLSRTREHKLATRALEQPDNVVGKQTRATIEDNRRYNVIGDAELESRAAAWIEKTGGVERAYAEVTNTANDLTPDLRQAACSLLNRRNAQPARDGKTKTGTPVVLSRAE